MDDLEGWLEVEASKCQRTTAAYLPTADAACLQQQMDHPVQQSAAYDAVQAVYAEQDLSAAFCNGYRLAGGWHVRGRVAGAGFSAAAAAAAAPMQQANLKQQRYNSNMLEPVPALAAGAGGADSWSWRTTRRAPVQPAADANRSPQSQQMAVDVEERTSKRQHIDQRGYPDILDPPVTTRNPYQEAAWQFQQQQHHAAHVQEEPRMILEDTFLDDDWLNEPAADDHWAGLFQRSTAPASAMLLLPAADTAAAQQQYAAPHTQQQLDEVAGEQDDEVDTSLVAADFDLSREEVIDRIEQLVQQLVCGIAAGQLPELTCVSTARNNVVLAHRDAEQQDADGDVDDDQFPQQVLRLGSRVQKRTMLGNGGQQAYTIARGSGLLQLMGNFKNPKQLGAKSAPATVLQLLDVVHGLLKQGKTATQRDIYYTLLSPPFFSRQRDLTSTIHATLSLLRVPRSSLGITAASKGAVAGRLLLRSRPGEAWQDCSLTGSAGRSIPGETTAIQAMSMRPAGARFILVVEKDAVFQRLVEDRLFDDLPCIIITGRGMPDLASRAFLAAVVAAAGPGLPVLGFVDWNPAGVHILLSYKYGTAAMGLEAVRYAVPSLCWLGINSDMLQEVPRSACQELTQRDRSLIPNLKAKLADSCPDWVAEIEEMGDSGLKVDIEALYGVLGHQGLAEDLSRRVVAQQYLS